MSWWNWTESSSSSIKREIERPYVNMIMNSLLYLLKYSAKNTYWFLPFFPLVLSSAIQMGTRGCQGKHQRFTNTKPCNLYVKMNNFKMDLMMFFKSSKLVVKSKVYLKLQSHPLVCKQFASSRKIHVYVPMNMQKSKRWPIFASIWIWVWKPISSWRVLDFLSLLVPRTTYVLSLPIRVVVIKELDCFHETSMIGYMSFAIQ